MKYSLKIDASVYNTESFSVLEENLLDYLTKMGVDMESEESYRAEDDGHKVTISITAHASVIRNSTFKLLCNKMKNCKEESSSVEEPVQPVSTNNKNQDTLVEFLYNILTCAGIPVNKDIVKQIVSFLIFACSNVSFLPSHAPVSPPSASLPQDSSEIRAPPIADLLSVIASMSRTPLFTGAGTM